LHFLVFQVGREDSRWDQDHQIGSPDGIKISVTCHVIAMDVRREQIMGLLTYRTIHSIFGEEDPREGVVDQGLQINQSVE